MLSSVSKKKKRSTAGQLPVCDQQENYRRRIMANTGVGAQVSIDPVYQLIGGFTQQFDAVGNARNAERHAGENEQNSLLSKREQPASREQLSTEELRRRHDSPVYSHSERQLAEGDFCDRFSSHAFHCGTLAASVMAGRGKEMFTTCVRRAGTYYRPGSQRERKVSGAGSASANIQNQPASVVFGREAHAAVGLVVDCIRSSSDILEMFKQLAEDREPHSQNRLQQYGVETMREMYPFLQLEQDRILIGQYKAQLKALEDDTSPNGIVQKKSLDAALKKAVAVKERKEAQQRRFLTVLSQITANVREAEKMFSSDGFADRILEELDQIPDMPPDDGKGKRRTLEDSPLGEILDALFGDNNPDVEAADGREAETAVEENIAAESRETAAESRREGE